MVQPGTRHGRLEGRGRTLDSVGHGTVLTGRYRLEERLRVGSSGALWRALDETLERSVQLTLLDPDVPRTADVLDAARRVTLAKDPRLVQVLDVGRDAGIAYVVSENLPGRTLTQAVTGAPLPAAEARRLVGEAAQALSGAADRGLHHQRLAPETLIVGSDGSVKLTGTAVEAAATGAEARDPAVASQVDALGLVCILYAALTGRWPGTTPSGLPSAPRISGRPVPPGELVPGVPADLDELCAQTLGSGQDGPSTPNEVAERLAPWPEMHPLTDPRGLMATHPATPGSISTGATPGTGTALPTPAALSTPAALPTQAALSTPAALSTGATASTLFPAPWPAAEAVPQAVPPSPVALAAAAAALSRIRRAEAAEPEDDDQAVTANDAPRMLGPVTASPPRTPTRPVARSPAVGLFGTPRRAVANRPAGSGFQGWHDLTEVGQPVTDDEPLIPFGQLPQAEEPAGSQSRFVIVVVVAFLVLVMLVAAVSLRSLGSLSGVIPQDTTRPVPTTTSSGGAGATRTGSALPTATAPSPAATGTTPPAGPQVVGAQAIDPQGDGQENDSQAVRAVDGDPSTAWRSEYYQTADFAGLKQGVGLVLSFGAGDRPDVQQVVVDVAGSGGTVELRTTDTPGLDGSTVLAQAPIENGRAVLTPAKPVNSRLLLLWFTRLPKTDGKYQLNVSEINVR